MGLRMNSVGKFALRARGPISDIPGFALQMLGKLTCTRLSFLIFRIRPMHSLLRQKYVSCLELNKRLLKGKLQLLLLHLFIIPLKLFLLSQDTESRSSGDEGAEAASEAKETSRVARWKPRRAEEGKREREDLHPSSDRVQEE